MFFSIGIGEMFEEVANEKIKAIIAGEVRFSDFQPVGVDYVLDACGRELGSIINARGQGKNDGLKFIFFSAEKYGDEKKEIFFTPDKEAFFSLVRSGILKDKSK